MGQSSDKKQFLFTTKPICQLFFFFLSTPEAHMMCTQLAQRCSCKMSCRLQWKHLTRSASDSQFTLAVGQIKTCSKQEASCYCSVFNKHIHTTCFPKSNGISYAEWDINRSGLWWNCLSEYFQYLSIVDILYTFLLKNPLASCVIGGKKSCLH